MFFIDDIFLRMFGLSIPPFDMIWLMETITDYVDDSRVKEIQQRIINEIRETRLLFELGEITKEEYSKRNSKLNHQRLMNKRVSRVNLDQRINILDS
jgi:cobalamin biosynthesis Mg chelatase CobN